MGTERKGLSLLLYPELFDYIQKYSAKTNSHNHGFKLISF